MANSLEKQSDIDQSSQKPDIIEEEHSETDTLFREEGDSEENLDEQMAEVMATPLEDDEFETLKKEETERIDNLLKSTLSFKDDNLPTEEIVIRGLKDTTTLMKVYYYKNDAELERAFLPQSDGRCPQTAKNLAVPPSTGGCRTAGRCCRSGSGPHRAG